MDYLYHGVPKDMRGNTLYPLNQLKEFYPDIYEKEATKYKNRGYLMEQKIPLLDCLWNDVLHFTAVPPIKIKNTLSSLGKNYKYKFYQIDPKEFSKENTVIYLFKPNKKVFTSDNFIEYSPEIVKDLQDIPVETMEYYKKKIESGEQPLMYQYIPHILHRGSIQIDKSNIIEV